MGFYLFIYSEFEWLYIIGERRDSVVLRMTSHWKLALLYVHWQTNQSGVNSLFLLLFIIIITIFSFIFSVIWLICRHAYQKRLWQVFFFQVCHHVHDPWFCLLHSLLWSSYILKFLKFCIISLNYNHLICQLHHKYLKFWYKSSLNY